MCVGRKAAGGRGETWRCGFCMVGGRSTCLEVPPESSEFCVVGRVDASVRGLGSLDAVVLHLWIGPVSVDPRRSITALFPRVGHFIMSTFLSYFTIKGKRSDRIKEAPAHAFCGQCTAFCAIYSKTSPLLP